MKQSFQALLIAFSTLLVAGLVMPQDGGGFKKQKKGKGGDSGFPDAGADFKKQKKDKGDDEDAKMVKILEKSYKKAESERDKVIKELSKLTPDQPLGDDFNQWYAAVAGSAQEWERGTIPRKQIGEIFDRMAYRLEIKGDAISRRQFLGYANKYWRADSAMPWKEAKEFDAASEAEKVFKHLDRDRDGTLSPEEMSASLRAELRRWDKDGDGRINFDEYRAFFPSRLERLVKEFQQGGDRPPAMEIPSPDGERPIVVRAGKLPAGLPAWFDQIDTDRDGQVALFEWRRAGWPLDEYAKLDLNDDGFLEAQEMVRVLSMTARDGSRPYAYLFQKQLGGDAKVAKKSSK